MGHDNFKPEYSVKIEATKEHTKKLFAAIDEAVKNLKWPTLAEAVESKKQTAAKMSHMPKEMQVINIPAPKAEEYKEKCLNEQ
jgi:hypothetical protein